MKRYDSYKDSGIEWIGEIPSHWNHASLKWYSQIFSGGTPSKDIEEYWINGTIPWLNSGSVNQWDVSEASEFITEDALNNSSAKWIPEESLIMALAGQGKTKGMVAQVKFKTTCNQSLGVIIPNEKVYSRHLLYWLHTNYQNIRNLGGGDKRDGLNLVMLGGIPIPIPPIEEQTAIANFLDQKTTQIDDLIAKKERLIQLLEEERTAIINQAVTKGLPAEERLKAGLDPSVPMKDSGIEWLGEIPEHWEVAKFNLFISIRHGHQFMNYDFTEDGIKVVKITQLHKDGYLDLSKCSYVSNAQLDNYQSILIKERDILMCLTGGTIGKIIRVSEVNEPLLQNYRVGHFSSSNDSKILDDYIFWLMSSESIVSQIFFQMRETGQPNIGMDDFGRMRITIPPIDEQENIVKYIELKTKEISEILFKTKQEIDLMKEYKTALISEVVTGKVDVRNEKLN